MYTVHLHDGQSVALESLGIQCIVELELNPGKSELIRAWRAHCVIHDRASHNPFPLHYVSNHPMCAIMCIHLSPIMHLYLDAPSQSNLGQWWVFYPADTGDKVPSYADVQTELTQQ